MAIKVKPSWILFLISGILIIAGIFNFKTGNFNYWLISHSFYWIGVIFFWFDK